MATAANGVSKRKQSRYSAKYRSEAFSLAERIGVAAAASELGLHATQIYQWRAKAAHEKFVGDRERQLREENARLKRQLAEKTEFAPARSLVGRPATGSMLISHAQRLAA
ncbi:transposase [Spiribacter vilamensis]|uniref:Transposase n=1 Tax=Spiribacter vilamensis TaxID=531306 RepID=A0A4V2GJC3_9GAMM|nr:transposase [Spiribacter vilamensis]